MWHGVRQMLLETFAEHKSLSLQHTLYAMGETVLNNFDNVREIHLSLARKTFRSSSISIHWAWTIRRSYFCRPKNRKARSKRRSAKIRLRAALWFAPSAATLALDKDRRLLALGQHLRTELQTHPLIALC